MPNSMRLFVEDKAGSGGYGSVSEYIRELIRLDQRMELARLDAVVARQTNPPSPARRDYR